MPPSTRREGDSSTYVVVFGEGALGFGFKWTRGVGAVVKALRPEGQAHRSGRVRVGDVVRRVGDRDCSVKGTCDDIASFKRALAEYQNTRPLKVVFARGS